MGKMDIFDRLGDTIVSVSKDATQKAKDLSELARIRMEMRAKNDYLNKLYLEIGKCCYELHKDDECREFDDHMQLIEESLESLEELKRQAGQIKGVASCSVCGQNMPLDAEFCSKCGAKLEKPVNTETDESGESNESVDSDEDMEIIFEDEEAVSAGGMQEEAIQEKINIEITTEKAEQ